MFRLAKKPERIKVVFFVEPREVLILKQPLDVLLVFHINIVQIFNGRTVMPTPENRLLSPPPMAKARGFSETLVSRKYRIGWFTQQHCANVEQNLEAMAYLD